MIVPKLNITSWGLNLIASATAQGKVIEFGRVIVAEAYSNQNLADWFRTESVAEGQVESVSLQTGIGGEKFTNITSIIEGSANGGDNCGALGLTAKIVGGTEILFAVATATDDSYIYFGDTGTVKLRVSLNLSVGNADSNLILYKHDSDYVSKQEYALYESTITNELVSMDKRISGQQRWYDTIDDAYRYSDDLNTFRIRNQIKRNQFHTVAVYPVGSQLFPNDDKSQYIRRSNRYYDLQVTSTYVGGGVSHRLFRIRGKFYSKSGLVNIDTEIINLGTEDAWFVDQTSIESMRVVDLIVKRTPTRIEIYPVIRIGNEGDAELLFVVYKLNVQDGILDMITILGGGGVPPDLESGHIELGFSNDIATIYPTSYSDDYIVYRNLKRDIFFAGDSELDADVDNIAYEYEWSLRRLEITPTPISGVISSVMLVDGIPAIVSVVNDTITNHTLVILPDTYNGIYKRGTRTDLLGVTLDSHILVLDYKLQFGYSNYITGRNDHFTGDDLSSINFVSFAPNRLRMLYRVPTSKINAMKYYRVPIQSDVGLVVIRKDAGSFAFANSDWDELGAEHASLGVTIKADAIYDAADVKVEINTTEYRPNFTQWIKYNGTMIPHMD